MANKITKTATILQCERWSTPWVSGAWCAVLQFVQGQMFCLALLVLSVLRLWVRAGQWAKRQKSQLDLRHSPLEVICLGCGRLHWRQSDLDLHSSPCCPITAAAQHLIQSHNGDKLQAQRCWSLE